MPTTAFPLIVVLIINGAKQAYEDWQRHKSDIIENNQNAYVVPHGGPAEPSDVDNQPQHMAAEVEEEEEEEEEEHGEFYDDQEFSDDDIDAAGLPDQTCEVYDPIKASLKVLLWHSVGVGDLIVCRDHDFFPADLVLLASSDPHGTAFVETSSLDGETNLKLRRVTPSCLEALGSDFTGSCTAADAWRGATVECDPPNPNVNSFEGVLTVTRDGDDGAVESSRGFVATIGPSEVLLRGCRLRNTAWILGVVVYTGKDTKIQRNLTTPPHKVSQVEYLTNILTLIILCVQLLICAIGAIVNSLLARRDQVVSLSYLDIDASNPGWTGFLTFFTWIALFSNFIPISLIVTMGMVKALQSYFIARDVEMYHEETKTHAATRTSDLNEELGQVKHAFTDKTGTLTANVMEFRKCCIAGEQYGTGITQIRRRVLHKQGITPPPDPVLPPGAKTTQNVNFVDPALHNALTRRDHPNHNAVLDFMLHLAINHSVVVEHATASDTSARNKGGGHQQEESEMQAIKYSASSPDEGALVYGARHFNISFFARRHPGVVLRVFGHEVEVEVLADFEFTSSRKRSSVICTIPSEISDPKSAKRYMLFCKGADSIILPRLHSRGPKESAILGVMEEYAVDGLRTLCLAKRELTAEETAHWVERYQEASISMEDRALKMDAIAAELETSLELQGSTGIEDRLQEGVSDTVEILREAGIKVWMLTGDKVETGINIGVATNLIDHSMTQILFSWDAMLEESLQQQNSQESQISSDEQSKGGSGFAGRSDTSGRSAAVITKLHLELAKLENPTKGSVVNIDDRTVIIDGDCLSVMLEQSNQAAFVRLCQSCKSILCCRVSPSQKGLVVSMVRQHQKKAVTLAIGDGANDCAMIQKAHVGIGLRGQEGLQAFNTSDYGLSQFRFLSTLLLVHGRWSYRRISKLVTYMFYKNIVVVMPIFYFAIISLFSGQKLYLEMMYQLYNVFLTSLPIIIFGVFDQDVDRLASLQYPQLYSLGLSNSYFSYKVFVQCIISALWHSVVAFAIPYLAVRGGKIIAPDFMPTDLWGTGQIVFFNVMVIVNCRVLIDTYYLTWMTWFVVGISVISWFVFMHFMSVVPFLFGESMGLLFRLLLTPSFFPLCIVVAVISLSRDICWKVVRRNFRPSIYHTVQRAMLARLKTEHRFSIDGLDEQSFGSGIGTRSRSLVVASSQMAMSPDTKATGSQSGTSRSRGFAFSQPDPRARHLAYEESTAYTPMPPPAASVSQ